MDLGHVLDSAHEALPRIEFFGALGADVMTRGAKLDDVLLDPLGHPVPTEGEVELGRWIGMGGCAIMVDATGNPMAATGGNSGELLPLVSNGGLSLLLTGDRLVGSFLVGKLGGAVPLRDGQALAFSYPLRYVDSVSLRTRKTITGKLKTTGFDVHTLGAPAVAAVTIDPDATLEYPSLNGDKRVDVRHWVEVLLRTAARDRGLDGVPDLELEDGDLVAYFPEPDGDRS